MPFLTAWIIQAKIDPTRIHVLSRGGMAQCYGPAGVQALPDIYDLRIPQQVRVAVRLAYDDTSMLKQLRPTTFERTLVREVATAAGWGKSYHWLHPHWMFQELAPFWLGQRGLEWIGPRLAYDLLPDVPWVGDQPLPSPAVAVKFYARATWPANPMTAQFAEQTIKQLAAEQHVILLDTPWHLDDHSDYHPPPLANVHRLTELAPHMPASNLLAQRAVLHHAVGFIGTYGGTAQFALRARKPTICLHLGWQGTMPAHRHLSEALAAKLGIPFQVLSLQHLPLIQTALPRVQWQTGPQGSSVHQPVLA